MNSKALCKIIVEQNIQLSKKQIKKIEDFAVKTKDPVVALALCLYTFDADASKMIDVIINSGKDDACYFAAGFVENYSGVVSREDLSKLAEFLDDNLPCHSISGGEKEWTYFMDFGEHGVVLKREYLKINVDNSIKQMRKRIQKAKKTEDDDYVMM